MSESARLEQETEQTRAELEGTLDELRQRITPGQVVDQLMERAREGNAGAFVRNFGQQVAANPIPVAVIGVGLAWLMMAKKQPQQDALNEEPGYAAADSDAYAGGNGHGRPVLRADRDSRFADMSHEAAETASGTAQAARDSLHDMAEQSRAQIGEAASTVKSSLQDSAASAGQSARRAAAAIEHSASEAAAMTRRLFDFCKEQPLILAGLGLAVGAALGAAFPSTRTEDELVGDASDTVKRRASAMADKVGAAVAAQDAATQDGGGKPDGYDYESQSSGYKSQAGFAAGSGAGGDLASGGATGQTANAAAEAEEARLPAGTAARQESGGALHLRTAE